MPGIRLTPGTAQDIRQRLACGVARSGDLGALSCRLVGEGDSSRLVRWPSPFLRTLEVEATLQAAGLSVEVTEAADADPADAAALPPVHCAVARAEQIVATLADVLLLLQLEDTDVQQHLSSCVSFITGPGRTGDIELTLTVGVHGPGELHLVLID